MIDFKRELNEQQFAAVTHPGGPLLILAGAGSGKTRALTYRAAYLVQEQKIDPHNILLLTFTNKAAGEMQDRLKKLVGVSLPFAGTFHSFCAKFLRREGIHIGIDERYVIYDDTDQMDVIKAIHKQMDLGTQFKPRAILSRIGSAKHELLDPKSYASMAQGYFQETVAAVYERYNAVLDKNKALDFDDLLLKTVQVLQTVDEVRETYQRRFEHVLIDEYQDTNKAQYLIAKVLSANNKNITVVGDASQSIYRWRGADYRNLEYLQTDFPELSVIKLEQNYRSTQPILDAAFSVISNNRSHPILSLWTNQKQGDLLKLYEAQDEKDEALFVASTLDSVHSTESTAILYRTNAQSRAFEEVLIRYGIPYSLVGGVKFYERKEVKDILAYLRLLLNPEDTVSFNRAEKNGKRRLRAVLELAQKVDVANTVSVELFDQVLGVTQYLQKFDPKVEADLARIENVQELRSVATQFESLTAFLENVALVEKNTLAELSDKDARPVVTLMTIHASKGLEFDRVFVAGLEEGVFPHSRSLLDPAELEEERRLCYVALTRARSRLHLTYARNRLFYGGRTQGMISRFVGEIPENLLAPVRAGSGSVTPSKRKPSVFEDDLLEQFLADELDIDELLK